ncbi:MAG TPA: transposase, partial [Streptosporangiaceae bacterium]|nr:transposase [Streptosporangiaceae bacterium]
MTRTRVPAGQAPRTSCAHAPVRSGTDEAAGERLRPSVVAERVTWCTALVQEMAGTITREHWNAAGMRELASGADPDGRALPSSAWMALRRLGWNAAPPSGVVVNDRITRMAQEQAGRTLRSAFWRDALT